MNLWDYKFSNAPSAQVPQKRVPFRKMLCMAHDIFKGQDSLALQKLSESRSYKSQRRWASCVRSSTAAREMLLAERVTNGRARKDLAQKITSEDDARKIVSVLGQNGVQDDGIVSYLKEKFKL